MCLLEFFLQNHGPPTQFFWKIRPIRFSKKKKKCLQMVDCQQEIRPSQGPHAPGCKAKQGQSSLQSIRLLQSESESESQLLMLIFYCIFDSHSHSQNNSNIEPSYSGKLIWSIRFDPELSTVNMEWHIGSTIGYHSWGPGFDSHPGWHLWKLSSPFFMTTDCKVYSWNITVTCNYWMSCVFKKYLINSTLNSNSV